MGETLGAAIGQLLARLPKGSIISVLIFLLYAGVGFFFLLATGHIPGNSGVALASETKALSDRMDKHDGLVDGAIRDIRIGQIENQLKDALHDSCLAIENNNQLALQLAEDKIYQKSKEYRALTTWSYERQPCEVILIKKTSAK